MPYGANHQEIYSDTFDSSIAASWDNGNGDYDVAVWATGGYIQANVTSVQANIARYDTESYNGSQYTILTIQAMGTASGMGAICRQQQGTDESGYAGAILYLGSGSFEINEKFSDFSSSAVAEGSTGYETPVSGDTITLEAEGTSLRMGYDGSGTDVEVLSGTDNTLANGQPASVMFDIADVTATRVTAFEAGNIAPTLVNTSFGGSGSLALSDTIITYDKTLSFTGTGTPSFSRLTSYVRSFAFGGAAALTLGRAISLNKGISATGAVESVQGVGATFEGSYTGTGSLSLSSSTLFGKALAYTASAALAISKKIGKIFSYVGTGTSTVTGDGIEAPTGRGLLRLLARAILRDTTRDK